MKRTKFTDEQIAFALKQAETGIKVAEVCRKVGYPKLLFTIGRKNTVDLV
jgi:putative transposase